MHKIGDLTRAQEKLFAEKYTSQTEISVMSLNQRSLKGVFSQKESRTCDHLNEWTDTASDDFGVANSSNTHELCIKRAHCVIERKIFV